MTTYTPRHRRDIDPIEDDWRPEAKCRCYDGIFCPLHHPPMYAAWESKHYGQPEAEVA